MDPRDVSVSPIESSYDEILAASPGRRMVRLAKRNPFKLLVPLLLVGALFGTSRVVAELTSSFGPAGPGERVPPATRYAGTGTQTIETKRPEGRGPTLLYLRTVGKGRVHVAEVGDKGQLMQTVQVVFGAYEGVTVATLRRSRPRLEVEAEGEWVIELRSPLSAPTVDTRSHDGSGDEVFWYTGGKGVVTMQSHSSIGLASVNVYRRTSDELLALVGSDPERRDWPWRGAVLVAVESDESWRLDWEPD